MIPVNISALLDSDRAQRAVIRREQLWNERNAHRILLALSGAGSGGIAGEVMRKETTNA
jgi:hypothetical protein